MPSFSDADRNLEPILYSGDPIEPGGGNEGGHRPGVAPPDAPPRLRGLPLVFLSRGTQVYVGDAPFTERTTFDDLVNRDEVRMVERRAAKRNEPLPDAFLFFNEGKTEMKLLLWTDLGFTAIHQRLDEGAYTFARNVPAGQRLTTEELADVLSGGRRRAGLAAASDEASASMH
jgi:hypothetical protein